MLCLDHGVGHVDFIVERLELPAILLLHEVGEHNPFENLHQNQHNRHLVYQIIADVGEPKVHRLNVTSFVEYIWPVVFVENNTHNEENHEHLDESQQAVHDGDLVERELAISVVLRFGLDHFSSLFNGLPKHPFNQN